MPLNKVFLTPNPQDKLEFTRMIEAAVREITASFQSDNAFAGVSPQQLKQLVQVDEILPQHGLGFDEVMKRLSEKILPYFLHPSSTAYMAHLHSSVLLESIVAELIISTFNQSMDSWDQSPVATEIEVNVIRRLCSLFGYGPESNGSFTSGGSQSNFCGLLLARDWFCNQQLHHDVKKCGLPPNFSKFRMYCSEIAHFSMEKSAHTLGLGYDAVIQIPVDDSMKMDVNKLRAQIQNDIDAGFLPFCVAATVGTTDFGSIDPLKELREICNQYNLWLHADAAYGSGVILADKYADRVDGLADCDSITVDFHKMFMLPISCSASLVKNAENLSPLSFHADYLNRVEDEEDGYTNLVGMSLQTTRRFDALKVWISFQMRGRDGWSELISTCIENAAYLYEQLNASPDFEPLIKPEISSVVFRLLPVSDKESSDALNKRVRRELLLHHGVVIGQTVCRGMTCLKFTLLNPLLTHERLDSLLKLIVSLR